MKLLYIINDVAVMEHDGIICMAAIDCFESDNYTIGCYINTLNGLPQLIIRTSIFGAHIHNLFKKLHYVK